MKRIMVVMGTRPEVIKLCPVVRELRARENVGIVQVCNTGQHRTLSQGALSAFGIKPEFDLELMQEGQGLSTLSARILQAVDALLARQASELVLVQGDTATAFAASLAAFYRGIPVVHVEAGLRTNSIRDPFPEELHRRAIALTADLHLAPTVTAKRNLVREGIHDSRIVITGNTVVDALRYSLQECKPSIQWQLPPNSRLLIFTAHRRENLGKPLRGMMRALKHVVETYADVIAVFPVHHNPEVRRAAGEILGDCERIRLMEPPELVSFHHLLSKAYLIMTDSGGIQEEAAALGIPTVVMRYSSERQEGLCTGVLKLAGKSEEGIASLTSRLLAHGSEEYTAMRRPSAVYGDGHAASRIADALEKYGFL